MSFIMPSQVRIHQEDHGGEGGIRTLDTGLGYTPLAGERLQPLGHLTALTWRIITE